MGHPPKQERNIELRRVLVSALAAGALLAAASAANADDLVAPASLAQCFLKQTASTPMVQHKAKTGPYKIAFSNSFYGNNWRTKMMKIAAAYAKQPQVAKYLAKFDIQNAGNNVAQ